MGDGVEEIDLVRFGGYYWLFLGVRCLGIVEGFLGKIGYL